MVKCIVKDCTNHTHEGEFIGDLCSPCHEFITEGKGVFSQAFRNALHVSEVITFEDMRNLRHMSNPLYDLVSFANAPSTDEAYKVEEMAIPRCHLYRVRRLIEELEEAVVAIVEHKSFSVNTKEKKNGD